MHALVSWEEVMMIRKCNGKLHNYYFMDDLDIDIISVRVPT